MDEPSWIIVGAGGHARSVMDVLYRQATGPFLFVVPRGELPSWTPSGSRVVTEAKIIREQLIACHWLVALGDNGARQRLTHDLVPPSASMPTVIAPTATVAADARLGIGVVVLEHAHIGPGAVIGDGVIVNTGAVIEHDAEIGSFVHIGPRAAVLGSGYVGHRTLVGAGCTILPGIRVGDDTVLGAGCVVVREITGGVTALGLPARAIGPVRADQR